jgi:putative inorganic carbon (HCO3(-)) transporter
MEWVIAILLVAPAAVLAGKRSSYLIDYAVFLFVLNRGIRRMVDYYINGYFNPLSPISLVPLVITLLMGIAVFTNQKRLPRYVKGIVALFLSAFTLAGAIGFLLTQLAVLYAGAEVLAPLFLMLYAILLNPPMAVRDRWIRSFAWGAILVSAYGWYQYLVIPPWDAFWLKAADMVGYMGIPEPTKMTVFSTMGERGVVAGYLGYSVVPMIVSPKWRTKLGWFAVLLVFSVILLTLSRGGIIIAVVATAAFLVINKGAKVGQVMAAAVVLALGGYYGISMIPNSERIVERFEQTVEKMDKDISFQARTDIMQVSVGTILSNPLGYGLGAVGLATRINTGSAKGSARFVDGGYFDIILTYGIPGTLLMLLALWKIWKQLKLRYKSQAYVTDHVLLARALILSLFVTVFFGNFLNQFSVLWLAMGTGLAIRAAGPAAGLGLRVAGNGSASVQNDSRLHSATAAQAGATRGQRVGSLLAAGYAEAREEEAAQSREG